MQLLSTNRRFPPCIIAAYSPGFERPAHSPKKKKIQQHTGAYSQSSHPSPGIMMTFGDSDTRVAQARALGSGSFKHGPGALNWPAMDRLETRRVLKGQAPSH